ncbi:MAG: hypothetical protein PHT07_06160 [Paludibacter sp.]|nr:hypothetical protein [Paludibacter sp.]
MKRFTKKAMMLVVAMLILGSVFVQAEKRYVFALGGFPKTNGVADPGWNANWVDFRLDDLNRILYIWASGETIAGTPAVGVGALGQTGYQAFNVAAPAGWWGCGYYVGPDSGNATASMDMTDVTTAGVFHFAIRTTCATDITINLYGSTVDPSDPFITAITNGKFIINTTNLPVSKRDGTQWVEFNVPMTQLMGPSVVATNNLRYLGPVKKCNYLTFAGGNDKGSFIAWDNVYVSTGATAVESVKADKLDISMVGNQLKVSDNTNTVNIFSVSGARVLSSKLNDIDISGLKSGVYVVKAGNRVSKFNK